MRRIGPFALVAAFAAYFAACDGAPLGTSDGASGDELSPRFDVGDASDPAEDTYLALNRKNTNYGGEDFLQVKKLEQDVALVRFADIADLVAGAEAGGRVFLDIVIDGTFANFGPGLSVGLYRVDGSPDWTETGATWNCGEDTNTGNNKANCAGAGWTWDPAGARPINSTAIDAVTISKGQTGVVAFEVTDDILAFGSGTPNNGWALARENDSRSGYVRFKSSETTMPPRLRFDPCSEEDVDEAGCVFEVVEEEEPFVIPADGGTGSTIAAFGSPGVMFEGTDATEVVFKVDVLGLGPCEDIPNAADVGVCTEITAFTTSGEPIPGITFTGGDAQVAFCLNYPGSGLDPLPDGTPVSPENAVDPLTRLGDALNIIQVDNGDRMILPPSPNGPATAALNCGDFENGSLTLESGNPFVRFARATFGPILGKLAPKSLHATSTLTHTKAKGSFIGGLSTFWWTSALVLYSSDGWTRTDGDGPEPVELPAGHIGSSCPLYTTPGQLSEPWALNTNIGLERNLAVQQAGNHDDGDGILHLLVSVGIDNDIAVDANGLPITRFISGRGAHPDEFDTKPKPLPGGGPANHSTAGFAGEDPEFLKHEGCAFEDQVAGDHITGDITFAVPFDALFGEVTISQVEDILLEITGRDRGGSSFLNVQVSLLELDEEVEPIPEEEDEIPQ